MTKNGLPPVVWCRRSGSIPRGRARAATASLVSAGKLEAAHPARGRQVADDPAQRVPGPDLVVAVGHHHHRRRGGHPAADEDQQVQGGLVGPVGVLDHRHHRPASGVEQVQERAEQAVPGRLGGDKGRQLPAGLAGDVEQRAERARGPQRVAGPPEDAGVAALAVAEGADQRGLADPGLAADQHQAAVPVPGLGQPPVERPQERPPFQQHHGRIVAPPGYTEVP